MRHLILASALAAVLAAPTAAAQTTTIEGESRVIDGDTIDVAGERVRLQGIDAPEQRQRCLDSMGSGYPCGQDATAALVHLIGHAPVRCELEPERDRYGRALGVCFTADGTDMNGWMVEQGHALAYRKYSERYVWEEDEARRWGRGMHRGQFVPPWDWRRGTRLTPQDSE